MTAENKTLIEIDNGFIDYMKSKSSDDELKMLHQCMLVGVIMYNKANAEMLKYDLENVTINGVQVGSYSVEIKKIGEPK